MEEQRCVDEKSWIKNDDTEKEEYTILQIDTPLQEDNQRDSEHTHSFSSRQMEVIVALCDTLLPSINISNDRLLDDSLLNLYHTSASMIGIPLQVAMMMSTKTEHPKQFLVQLSLWLLSTAMGTLILCGRGSLSNQFPYVQKFSRVSSKEREAILVSWSVSYFFLLRMLFRALKFVNEKNENPSWKAIDYCGPDPDFVPQISHAFNTDDILGPLYTAVVCLNKPRQMVAEALQRSRLAISIPRHPKLTSMVIKCDVVVVGSGSGGGVVAGVLAKSGYKVLVLEKGNYRARSNLSLLEGPSMDEMYLGKGLLATSNMEAVILAGSTVGGGSAINWSASIRTPQHVLKEWSECYELELFQSGLYEEAMDVICERMGVQSEIEDEGFNNTILRKGCEELGYPVNNIPRNSPPDHYCGWCCLGCKDGRKKGTSETWLVDVVESGNGAILPGCEAVKVVHDRKKGRERSTARGVMFEFRHQDGSKEVCLVESKVTIVSCGAMCTPQLLKRSGLKNPSIGKNLHIHPVAMAWGHFPLERWPEVEKKSYKGGIMTAMSTVVADFKGSGYGAIIQTPALHPGMFSALMPWVSGSDFKNRMTKFSRTAHIFALARDKGSGELGQKSSISYQMDIIDEENLKRGLEKSLRILAAAGAEEIGTHNNKGRTINVKKVSYRELEKFVREESSRALRDLSTPICSAHQMGSCRMGVTGKGSAVNPMGETWEVEGLYVADASVFPTALGVNPMVTVQAIAYCTAQSVLESLKRMKDTGYGI
ncbi:Alcohol dehydrogenase, long-chain fatty [Cynara cardunculus var. scolymus]|uniref:Long-chain-alcohol oxidase n=1 Tax=Cynara cardunculus var. scolymus TaxID=59895 RepID=A0A103XFL1_CYNCS|nr:Alcohol dehydrogenase, long-chain fatty [Cynara cardunculus var. scolymus]